MQNRIDVLLRGLQTELTSAEQAREGVVLERALTETEALRDASVWITGFGLIEPVDLDGLERFLVRAPLRESRAVTAALREAAGVRSAHKDEGSVRVQVDPLDIA